jgi:hypothetical protein
MIYQSVRKMDVPDLTGFLDNFGWIGSALGWILNIMMQNLIITLLIGGVLLVIILNWKHIWGYTQREVVG